MKKFLSIISAVLMSILFPAISASAADINNTVATGDNSNLMIIVFIGIGVAALVVVILALFGGKKKK